MDKLYANAVQSQWGAFLSQLGYTVEESDPNPKQIAGQDETFFATVGYFRDNSRLEGVIVADAKFTAFNGSRVHGWGVYLVGNDISTLEEKYQEYCLRNKQPAREFTEFIGSSKRISINGQEYEGRAINFDCQKLFPVLGEGN